MRIYFISYFFLFSFVNIHSQDSSKVSQWVNFNLYVGGMYNNAYVGPLQQNSSYDKYGTNLVYSKLAGVDYYTGAMIGCDFAFCNSRIKPIIGFNVVLTDSRFKTHNQDVTFGPGPTEDTRVVNNIEYTNSDCYINFKNALGIFLGKRKGISIEIGGCVSILINRKRVVTI